MNLRTVAVYTFALCTGISCFTQVHNEQLSRWIHGRTQNECPSSVNDTFCLNGGVSRAEKIYRQTVCYCECPSEYFGERCEIRRKSDESKPCDSEVGEHFCMNGGTCLEGNVGQQLLYYCECPKGFWKEKCQTKSLPEIEPCPPEKEETFCMNGGTCYLHCIDEVEHYFCECPRDYTGIRCQHETLPEQACAAPFYYLLCLNGGTCSRLIWKYDLIYSCHCTEGYYGVRCEREMKHAGNEMCEDESFCYNGGTCYAVSSETEHIYFCECIHGYTGQRCELQLESYGELCLPSIHEIFCRNGGTCYEGTLSGVPMYYCQCRAGFWGARCEEQTIQRLGCPLTLSLNLCNNGGTCLAITSSGQDMVYFCKCADGFSGIACEYVDKPLSTVSECPPFMAQEYCLNNGTCYKDTFLEIVGYYCVCPYPYHGERCELKFPTVSDCPDSLDQHLCTKHGTCIQIALKDLVIYYCDCLMGYYGIRCEHYSSEAATGSGDQVCPPSVDSVLCLHGGTCVQVITSELHKLYFCKCVAGFYGFSCEFPYPPVHKTKCPPEIADNHCLNGGTCLMMVYNGLSSFYCECPTNFQGDKCQLKREPKFDLQDFSGTQCPHNIAKSYCQNGGTCYMEFSSAGEPIYYCACARPYYGERCEEKVHRRSLIMPSESNGTCPPLMAATKCQNGGTCVTNVTHGETVPYCICPDQFYGDDCEFHSPVSNYRLQRSLKAPCPPEMGEYCQHGGTCYMTETQQQQVYRCECSHPYFGERCEYQYFRSSSRVPCPEHVANDFCENGGTCYMQIFLGFSTFHCMCTPPYIGKRCEQSVYYRSHSDQCSPENANKFCQNGGTCLSYTFTGATLYHCHCPYPFYGKSCELKYSEPLECPSKLKTVLCLNNGVCVQAESNGHYVSWCQCPENYYGARCEHQQPRKLICPPHTDNVICMNGGTCVAVLSEDGQQLFFCLCTEAFTGPSCEYSRPYIPTVPDVCPPVMKATFCLNGGTCQADHMVHGLKYFCKCSYPYHGDRCEHKFSAVSPCPQSIGSCLCCNEGECSKISLEDCDIYYCKCAEGFSGARCEHAHETQQECPHPFSTELCKNAGTCISIITTGKQSIYFCKCVEGFYGMSCEYPYPALQLSCVSCPPYIASICLNGGKCCTDMVLGLPIYYCICPEPYYGNRCDLKHSHKLSCSLPFKNFFCLNGGLCVQGKSNGYDIHWCECASAYYGARCEHHKYVPANQTLKCPYDLQKNLCKNGGTCVGIISSAERDLFFCECPERFYGLYCENLHTPVPSAVVCPHDKLAPYCLHGGTCRFDAFQSLYYCICPNPYAGERCEYMIPVRSSCPHSFDKYLCTNGGMCIYIKLVHHGIYFCKCLEGFYGSRCEYNSEEPGAHLYKCPNPLDVELCKNGGTCYGVHQPPGTHHLVYFCKCLENFSGLSCEHQNVHEANRGMECPSEIEQHFCQNGGTCFAVIIEAIIVYYCECLPPHYGGRCEFTHSKSPSCPWALHQYLCLNGGTCSSLLENDHQCVYYCECSEGYGGHRCENKIFTEIETEYCNRPASDWFCLNNGTCFQEVINGQTIYHCECKKNFFGERCQLEVTDRPKTCSLGFHELFCLQGGTCYQARVDQVIKLYCHCQDGFIGERCEFKQPKIRNCCPPAIDRIFCLNGGTCYMEMVQQQEQYKCACQGHYFGEMCEHKPASTETCPSDLAETFCLNGGTCLSFVFESVTVYYCQCADGYYGGRCEHAVNNTLVEGLCTAEIADWFCANGGTCFHILILNEPFYYCECPKQYTGARCESKMPSQFVMCSENITEIFCRLGSECYDMVIPGIRNVVGSTTFHYCVCAEGYRGMRCQYEKHKHTCPAILGTEFCLNGATCRVLLFKGHIVYYCECTTEYYGLRCETKFPYSEGVAYPCDETVGVSYCMNGGTCYETTQSGEKLIFCECPEGYSGLKCEYEPNQTEYDTDCPPQVKDSYCKNGGTCRVVPDSAGGNTYVCECVEGYTGPTCESTGNSDLSNEPSNCYPPYNETLCLNGGTCYQDKPGPDEERRCYCPPNYYGQRCEFSTTLLAFQCPQDIVSYFCYNGGTCYQADHGPDTIYFCHCPKDYQGLRCEYGPESVANQTQLCPPPFNENYCQNGGTCYQMYNGTHSIYICECPPGFSGSRCEHWSHPTEKCDFPLDTVYCFNGGTCQMLVFTTRSNQPTKIFYCTCTPDYYGSRCEIPMPCAGPIMKRCDMLKEKEFCLNNGVCYESECKDMTVYACTCPEGYTGARCEYTPARRQGCPYPLDTHFCLNGGLCVTLEFENHAMYSCLCPKGYSGERCEMDVTFTCNFCPIEFGEIFCLNGGVCYETMVMNVIVYYCECLKGYWGERCEFSGVIKHLCPNSLDNIFCLNGANCYMVIWAGSDIYYCECAKGFAGTRCDKKVTTLDAKVICLSEACQNLYSAVDSREILTNYSNMQYILNNSCCPVLEHHTYVSKILLCLFLSFSFILEITNCS